MTAIIIALVLGIGIGYGARHFKTASRVVDAARSDKATSKKPTEGEQVAPETSAVTLVPPPEAPSVRILPDDWNPENTQHELRPPADHHGDTYVLLWFNPGLTPMDVQVTYGWGDNAPTTVAIANLCYEDPAVIRLPADEDGRSLTVRTNTPICARMDTHQRNPEARLVS